LIHNVSRDGRVIRSAKNWQDVSDETRDVPIDPPDTRGTPPAKKHDVFVSYSRVDKAAARLVADTLTQEGLRVFIDEDEIEVGAAWQQAIFDALEECRCTLVMYSSHFLQSKVCKDEFNIAMILRRRKGDDFIFPVLVSEAELPAYMEMLNYTDCRIADPSKLKAASSILAKRLIGAT